MTWPTLIVVQLAAADPHVALKLEGPLPCSLEASLAPALSERSIAVDARARVQLRVFPESGVTVRLEGPEGLRGARTLTPGADDCPVLARTIALLTRAWLEASLLSGPQAAAETAVAPPSVNVVDIDDALDGPELTLTRPAPLPPHQLADTMDAAPPEVVDAPKGRSGEVIEDDEGTAGPPASLSALISAGAALAPDDVPVFVAQFASEWGFLEPWGLGLEVGIESQRKNGTARDFSTAEMQWAGLFARRIFFANGTSGLHVALGLRGVHIHAGSISTGPILERNADLFTGALAGAVEWRGRTRQGLVFFARFCTQARLRPERVTDGKSVITVPPWGFALTAGIGWSSL